MDERLMANIYTQEQVVYLMQAALVNINIGATTDEMLQLIDLVETHDEEYEKIRRVAQ